MPITVSHALSATTPDDPAYEIKPSNWNSNHAATFAAVGSEISGAFSNAGNVTFGLETNGFITASANAAGAGDGFNRISAGTQLAGTNNTIVFSNSNGITFGLSNSSVMTASHNGLTSQTVQTQNMVSVLGSTGNISFANGNGITFGGNASTVTASHNGLTTARASNDGVGLNTAQSNVTWTVNSSGLSLDARGYAGTGTSATNASVTLNSNGIAISVAAPGGAASQTLYATGNTTVNSSGTQALSSLLYRGYGVLSIGTSNGSVLFSTPDPVDFTALSVGMSTGGNTSGNTGLVTGQLVLAGGNNITLSGSTNGGSMSLTISGGAGGNFTAGISGGNTAGDTGTVSNRVVFAGGANITLSGSTNGGSQTISIVGGAGGAGYSAGISTGGNTAGATGLTGSNMVFVGSGPISLSQTTGANGGTISINAPATSSLSATGAVSLSTNGSTISIGVGTVTAYATSNTTQNSSGTINLNSLLFHGAGIASVGYSNGSVVVSVPSGGGAGDGVNILAAGTQTAATTGTVSFANSNGITFGMSNSSVITASHNGLTSQSNQAWSGSNASSTFQTLSFNNANGASWSNNGGAVELSYTVPTQSNQTGGIYAVGNTTGQSSSSTYDLRTLSIDGAGIVSAGWSNGTVRISATQSNQAFSAGAASSTFQTLSLQDSNGVSFSNNAGAIRITHGLAGTGTAITGNASITLNSGGMSFNGSNLAGVGTTFNGTNISASMTLNSAGLRLDASVGAGGGGVTPVVSANNGSYSFTTLSLSNANGISFGTSAGSAVTASYTVPSVTQYFSNTATTFNGANISGSITNNTNGLQLSLSVAAPGAAAENNAINLLGANTAGNTTATGSTIGWSGVNVTLSGTNASQVVISAPATSSLSATGQLSISTNGSTISIGVGRTISGLALVPFAGLGGPIPFAQSSISLGQNSLYMYPVQIEDYLTCDHIRMPLLVTNSSSAAASVQKGETFQVGIYTRHSTNATLLSRHYSTSYTIAASHNSNVSWAQSLITGIGNSTSYNTLTASSAGINLSASLHGAREFIMPVSSLFAPGEYMIAVLASTSSAGAGGAVLNLSNLAVAYQTFNQVGASTNATGSGFYQSMLMGTYSATTGALPASISATQINQLGTMPILFAAMGTR